jgi:uncharacterized surface protein with fasciclin (FAS1) repeats
MTGRALSLGLTAAVIALSACSEAPNNEADGNAAAPVQTDQAAKAAGDQTIAAGIAGDGRFVSAAKAAGLDATLAGPGPYTVLIPDDAAFDKLPAGALDGLMKPEARAQLTGVLTYHILPGTVLAEDIGKAIDNAKGKAVLATMGGSTLTATREGGKVVLTDAAGTKAAVTRADDKYSNGVVHHIDAVLMPEQQKQ